MRMMMVLRCPVCSQTTTGNPSLGLLCGNCNMIFPPKLAARREERKNLLSTFEEYVMSASGDTYHTYACKYAKRITDPVPVQQEKTAGLRACKCTKLNA